MARWFRLLARYPLGSAFVVGFLVILGILGWKRFMEPRYHGKGITEWIEQLPHDNAYGSESNEAIDSLGVEALPYLLEAMQAPTRMHQWVARNAPGPFQRLAPDEGLLRSASHTAMWKLGEMAEGERWANEGESEPAFPIGETIRPVVLKFMRQHPERIPDLHFLLERIGPLSPEMIEELRVWWRGLVSGTGPRAQWGMREIALLLAGTGKAELAQDFLPGLHHTNATPIRMAAAEALGELGCRDEEVKTALRKVLHPNEGMRPVAQDLETVFATLRACALLGFCPPEARSWLAQPWLVSSGYNRVGTFRVLAWLNNPNSEIAATLVGGEISHNAPIHAQVEVAKLLGRIGPPARQFVPALTELLAHHSPMVRAAAAEALKRIELGSEGRGEFRGSVSSTSRK